MIQQRPQYRDLWKKLLVFAAPIAFQNLLFTLLNMLDTFMVGQLGEVPIAAVALCNQVAFVLILFLFGVSSGCSVFTAQFWGKGDKEGLWQAQAIALLVGLSGGLLIAGTSFFAPSFVLGLFSKDPQVILQGTPFLRIASMGYLFQTLVILYSGVLKSTGNVRLPMLISLLALTLNALFNYLLIFGKLGFPRLGIRGAAIATTGARILEAALILGISYSRKEAAAMPLRIYHSLTRGFVGRYVNRALPVVLNEIGWSLGVTMFSVVMARISTSALAAYNVSDTIFRLTLVIFIGLGNGASIVLGNAIGGGERGRIQGFSKQILFVLPGLSVILGTGLFFLAPVVPRLFKLTPEAVLLVVWFTRTLAVALIFKSSNLMAIVGMMRAGGDTRFSLIMDVAFLWGLGVPLVVISGLVLGWPPQYVYMLAMTEEVVKYFFSVRRIASGKWIQDVTV